MQTAPFDWRRIAVMAVAVIAFIALYEATVLDSKRAASQAAAAEVTAAPEPGRRRAVTATAYCTRAGPTSGGPVRAGIAAADPQLLPVGTVVEIEAADSRYNGIYTILDTGPAVQGPIVDIYMWSCHEALRFGRMPIGLTVLRLGWDP